MSDEFTDGRSLLFGQLPEVKERHDEIDEVGDHEADVAHPLMPHPAVLDYIRPELVS